MRKWLVVLLGLLTITLWSTVIFIAVTKMQGELYPARPHSVKDSAVIQERSVPPIPRLYESEVENKGTAEGETIMGKMAITEAWVDDVAEDGRLSIDTLLASLEVDQDPTE
ncbi:hypothetical protein SAMN05421743_10551 [Thalassobacillus cyri]|uniref:Uncharacterized protein n=1 Tax=Thalassobacillus cyri TaxID=571932 RepID=A0A1H4BJB2_9BACI|nr:hypothetical protein [Thalassobacillus cyri]SEA48118.1 hypothetical protein SAMN05421743_10551 [Thalassobacillus cyri]